MVSVKELLKKKLGDAALSKVRKSFDLLGTIAIIEIPKELRKHKKLIAKAFMKSNNRIQTVLLKTGAHSGKYRIEPLQFVLGKKTFSADYVENSCRFRVPLNKVYFSPRLSSERLRIAQQVKPEESVAVFFGGVGPYAVVIAKKSKPKKVVSFEWNPVACVELDENAVLNKVEGLIVNVQGDVSKTSRLFFGAFDRVIMPSPENAKKFLKLAVQCLKPEGGIIHYYAFSKAIEPFEKPFLDVQKAAKPLNRTVLLVSKKVVRPYSKETVQVVLDVEVKA